MKIGKIEFGPTPAEKDVKLYRLGISLMEQQIATLTAERDQLRAENERLRADAERLVFFCGMMDVIGGIDIHEEAAINASAFGRDEPNDADYLAAIRTAIDSARKEST